MLFVDRELSLDQILFLVTILRLEYLVAIFSLQNRELYLVTDLIHNKKDANNAFLSSEQRTIFSY